MMKKTNLSNTFNTSRTFTIIVSSPFIHYIHKKRIAIKKKKKKTNGNLTEFHSIIFLNRKKYRSWEFLFQ